MLNLQTKEYMEQMSSSIGDKIRILDWIKGDKILDAGCGSGALSDALYREFGYNVFGIDLSLLSYEEMKKRGIGNRFIHGNLLDMSIYFEEGRFDTIIFSSVLHEVFSYTGFEIRNVVKTLLNAKKIIPKGGRIIIRDGVKANNNDSRIIRFKNINDIAFLTEYCRRFKGRRVSYKKIDKLTFEMDINDAMEFLYTYTWGWKSFDREVQEQYGIMSGIQYKNLAQRLGFKIIHYEEYIQEGYSSFLQNKIDFFDGNMNRITLPNSNMLIVLEK